MSSQSLAIRLCSSFTLLSLLPLTVLLVLLSLFQRPPKFKLNPYFVLALTLGPFMAFSALFTLIDVVNDNDNDAVQALSGLFHLLATTSALLCQIHLLRHAALLSTYMSSAKAPLGSFLPSTVSLPTPPARISLVRARLSRVFIIASLFSISLSTFITFLDILPLPRQLPPLLSPALFLIATLSPLMISLSIPQSFAFLSALCGVVQAKQHSAGWALARSLSEFCWISGLILVFYLLCSASFTTPPTPKSRLSTTPYVHALPTPTTPSQMSQEFLPLHGDPFASPSVGVTVISSYQQKKPNKRSPLRSVSEPLLVGLKRGGSDESKKGRRNPIGSVPAGEEEVKFLATLVQHALDHSPEFLPPSPPHLLRQAHTHVPTPHPKRISTIGSLTPRARTPANLRRSFIDVSQEEDHSPSPNSSNSSSNSNSPTSSEPPSTPIHQHHLHGQSRTSVDTFGVHRHPPAPRQPPPSPPKCVSMIPRPPSAFIPSTSASSGNIRPSLLRSPTPPPIYPLPPPPAQLPTPPKTFLPTPPSSAYPTPLLPAFTTPPRPSTQPTTTEPKKKGKKNPKSLRVNTADSVVGRALEMQEFSIRSPDGED